MKCPPTSKKLWLPCRQRWPNGKALRHWVATNGSVGIFPSSRKRLARITSNEPSPSYKKVSADHAVGLVASTAPTKPLARRYREFWTSELKLNSFLGSL